MDKLKLEVLLKVVKGTALATLVGPPVGAAVWYAAVATQDQKTCTSAILGKLFFMIIRLNICGRGGGSENEKNYRIRNKMEVKRKKLK